LFVYAKDLFVEANPLRPNPAEWSKWTTASLHSSRDLGNPAGRLRGSRNKLSEEVICALLRDFREHGQKAIAKVRRTQPAAYLKICALLVPKEIKLERTNPLSSLSDEELDQAIEAVQAMLAAQASEGATVIDGTAEPAALPAATEPAPRCRKRPNLTARAGGHGDWSE
jgi:hypothetical protein